MVLFSFRYSELNSEKQKMARSIKEKDEEIDNLMQGLDKKRQDVRRAEKQQKEVMTGWLHHH